MADITKSPRIYIKQPLSEGLPLSLDDGPLHYLRNVMRVAEGQAIRLFNGKDGEFIGRIERVDKKHIEITIENRIREQRANARRLHLLLPPIKKERMDWATEKAVELGATDIHFVLTQNTDVRKINMERIEAQVVEAAEQCERMDVPALHDLKDLHKVLNGWDKSVPLYAAIERMGCVPIPREADQDCALLVGPSGGFTAEEKQDLLAHVTPVSLGKNILRTETAVVAGLSLLSL